MEEQLIDLSQALPPSGGLQDADKLLGWRGKTPVMVSPNQIRETTGIDHSILTEQLVPGEYFPYKDGTKRQVFCRTLVGTTPVEDNIYGIILSTGINAIPVSAIGNIDGMCLYSTSYHPSKPANASSSINVARREGYDRGDIIITSTRRGGSPYPKGIPYTITIKYIKL